jgi:hypothetical protein
MDSFRKANPRPVGKKQNAETGDVTYYVQQVPVIPGEVPLIVGDILHNLRCALDYVACGLVGDGNITSKTKFPIRRDAEDWEVSGLRMVDGASKDAIEALRRIRPYERGNAILYVLHALNNIDKHRLLLIVTLRNIARTMSEGEQVVGELLDKEGTIFAGDGFPKVPLYAGQELLTVSAAQAQKDMGFLFQIAFAESCSAKGMPILVTLKLASDTVRKTVRELAPFMPH